MHLIPTEQNSICLREILKNQSLDCEDPSHIRSKQKNTKKLHHKASMYDTFSFVDQITNNRLAYRQARKNSTSCLQLRKCSRIQGINNDPSNSLLSVYKKTKNFELKSLKEKIFRKAESKSVQMTRAESQKTKQNSNQSFLKHRQKSKAVRSFIDLSTDKLNRKEFHRIATSQSHNVNSAVIELNRNLKRIKTTLNTEHIEVAQKVFNGDDCQNREVELLEPTGKGTVLSQPHCQKVQSEKQNRTKVEKNPIQSATDEHSTKSSKFLRKMLNYASNHIRKEGEYLIVPPKHKKQEQVLKYRIPKKGFNKQNTVSLFEFKNSQNLNFQNLKLEGKDGMNIDEFSFKSSEESKLLKKVKKAVEEHEATTINRRLETAPSAENSHCRQIMHLLKNNFVGSLGLELLASKEAHCVKDHKGNNLLHLSVRHQKLEVIEMVFKKLNYRQCRKLLQERNSHKRTPRQMAVILCEFECIRLIDQYVEQNKDNQEFSRYLDRKDLEFQQQQSDPIP